MTSNVKVGLVLAVSFVILLSIVPVYTYSQSAYIPDKAIPLIPVYAQATDKIMPGFNKPQFFLAQGEHESCVSLKSKRCLDPSSELKSAREQGVGIPQITRTFRPDGTIRFDTLSNLKQSYPSHLKDLTWDNIRLRTDLQLTAQVLLYNEGYRTFSSVKDNYERIAMAAASYNGGPRDVQKSRYLCGLAKGCDPGKWFGNTEKYCVKSKTPLYGARSACDINTEYPADILHNRVPKYQKKYLELGYKISDIKS